VFVGVIVGVGVGVRVFVGVWVIVGVGVGYKELQLIILNRSHPSEVIILIPTAGAISNGEGNTTSTDDGTEVLIWTIYPQLFP
jgi:hypothetical protein